MENADTAKSRQSARGECFQPVILLQIVGIHFRYARMIELDRLRMETRRMEKKKSAKVRKSDPDRVVKMPSESRGGVMQIYTKVFCSNKINISSDTLFTFPFILINFLKICSDCGEEFCYGTCNTFNYEDFKVCTKSFIKFEFIDFLSREWQLIR